ncbi:MAG: CPBP family intramembrane glutamic endopeptidase [Candidatus Altiarchaeota archaeon]
MSYTSLTLALLMLLASRFAVLPLSHVASLLVLYVLVPVAYVRVSGGRLSEFNIAFGDVRLGLKYSLILLLFALPFMYYGSTLQDFREYYPLWDSADKGMYSFVYHEFFVMGVLMFCTEFFFRGFLLQSLAGRTRYANLIHSLLYMYVHLGKPGLEVWWSLPAGYVFGEVDVKCRSILPSFLMHWISSMTFNAMILYL